MARDYLEHWLAIYRIASVWTHRLRDARRLQVRLAGHQRGNRAGVTASLVGVVGQPERHQQRPQISVAQTQFAEVARVAADFLGGVRRVVDQDVLRRDHHVDRVAKSAHVELAALIKKLEYVDRRQVAGRVVQVHVLAARIGGVDAARVGAGVPIVDGSVELHPGIAAGVRRLRDHPHQVARLVSRVGPAVLDEVGSPFAVCGHRAHELVRYPHRIVGVLEKHRAVGGPIERGVVAGVDQRPRLVLLLLFAFDEELDVGMVDVEHHHLGRTPGLAARLDYAR